MPQHISDVLHIATLSTTLKPTKTGRGEVHTATIVETSKSKEKKTVLCMMKTATKRCCKDAEQSPHPYEVQIWSSSGRKTSKIRRRVRWGTTSRATLADPWDCDGASAHSHHETAPSSAKLMCAKRTHICCDIIVMKGFKMRLFVPVSLRMKRDAWTRSVVRMYFLWALKVRRHRFSGWLWKKKITAKTTLKSLHNLLQKVSN